MSIKKLIQMIFNKTTANSKPHPTPEQTPYAMLGGEDTVRKLANRFYDVMETAPEAAELYAIHPLPLDTIRQKFFQFLSGWLGGPPLYTDKFGHPMLRARHLPFAIGLRPLLQPQAAPVPLDDLRAPDQGDQRTDRQERQPRAERRDRNRDDRPRDDRPRDERPREERRDDRRGGRDRDDRGGPQVVGMGDHVPDFILRSFKLPETKVEEIEDDSVLNSAEA